ncbi:MAG: LamG domain-containing protein [Saprospiraceae bacterium]|nr:LamG domain-containing protein [Saprospiraceae bacterium]
MNIKITIFHYEKSKIYNTLFLLFSFITFANAQFEGVVKHWSFDENSRDKDYFSLFKTSDEVAFSSGIEGQSVSLLDKNYYVRFGKYVDLEEDFSLVFWFNVLENDGVQSVLLQSKTNANGEVNRYFHLAIADGKLLLKNEKTGLGLLGNIEIQSNFWYQLTYIYNGFETKIYLDKTLIFQSTETSIFTKLPCCTDELFIGKSANSAGNLKGYVDEIMIFEEGIETEKLTDIHLIMNLQPPKIEVDTPKIYLPKSVVQTRKVRTKLAKSTNNRRNELQDSVFVHTKDIEIEIWDYDEFDKDKVRFVMNDKTFYTNILLAKNEMLENTIFLKPLILKRMTIIF